jgi:dienelactone hydrolase
MRLPAVLPFLLLLSAASLPVSLRAAPIPSGDGYQIVKIRGSNLEVFTYKPAGYDGGPLLLVMHGVERDADVYRDNARTIADRFGMVVVAPLFDKSRFPSALYQRGGIVNQKALQPQDKWTGILAVGLVEQLRRDEGRPDLDYYMIGHSAGGQFLARLAPFVPHAAKRIVIANPSSWVFPTAKEDFPFGLGGATSSLANDDFLKRYLAAPITVYLGAADTGSNNRDDSDDAVEQGATRYERGLNFYRAGEVLAKQKGWALNWRLVEVPKVGHSSRRMFESPLVKAALFD